MYTWLAAKFCAPSHIIKECVNKVVKARGVTLAQVLETLRNSEADCDFESRVEYISQLLPQIPPKIISSIVKFADDNNFYAVPVFQESVEYPEADLTSAAAFAADIPVDSALQFTTITLYSAAESDKHGKIKNKKIIGNGVHKVVIVEYEGVYFSMISVIPPPPESEELGFDLF